MELIDIVPEFNLYEEYWKIYTKSDVLPPQFISADSVIERCLIGEGSEIYGKVYNSVIGCGVTIGEGTIVSNSIIMNHSQIGGGCNIEKAIIDENVCIGDNVEIGLMPEKTVIPSDVKIGKNTVISGETDTSDYSNGCLDSGKTLIKAGETL